MTASTRTTTIAAPKRRVVKGLPVYVVDGPPPARCVLMFRVGMSDETLPTRGITHMVEHLALFGSSTCSYSYNGFVDPHRTAFHAEGTEEECLEFLAGVTSALGDLPMHRLDQERRVLAAEEAGKCHGLFSDLAINRFGARGFGLLGYGELGVKNFDAHALQDWVDERFTARNAVLILSGVDPERVEHDLPAGERWPVVEPEQVDEELPGWFPSRGRGLGLSMVGRRSPALDLGLRVLQKRLFHRLRTEMAIVYDVVTSMHGVDPEIGHLYVACDPPDDRIDEAQVAIDKELARLAADGPNADEMEADRQARERSLVTPEARLGLAQALAGDELMGAGRSTTAKWLKAQRSVNAGDVAVAMAVARRTALWALPAAATIPTGLGQIARTSNHRLEGRKLAPATPKSSDDSDDRLVVGQRGVGLESSSGWHVHVEYERCAGALVWGDGTRVLIGDDGFSVTIRPWEWKHGTETVAEIDATVDKALVVPMGGGDGPPPPPPTPDQLVAESPPQRRSAVSKAKRVALVLLLAVCALVGAFVPFTGPSLKAAELGGVPAGSVPVDSAGYVKCGGSALSIWRHGAVVSGAGPQAAIVGQACEEDASTLMLGSGLCIVLGVAVGGWWGYRSLRRRRPPSLRPSATYQPAPA